MVRKNTIKIGKLFRFFQMKSPIFCFDFPTCRKEDHQSGLSHKISKKNKIERSGDLKFRPDQHTAAFIIRKQSGASDWFLY
jgi:hypothetical protein